jgi:uncharacterized protein
MKKLFRYFFISCLCFLISCGLFFLSSHLWESWTFKQDYRAAELGNVAAQHKIGLAYSVGKVVTQNDALAVQWFRKAAEQGYPNSQHSLALRYDDGRGVEQDYRQAVAWYQKAAVQNYAKSMINLGVIYSHGQGVELDKQKALYWYQKGAELGDDMAQHHLADLYLEGHDAKSLERHSPSSRPKLVMKDEAKARYWFEKSARQGYAESQYKLARLYLDEKGRFGRDSEAVMWLKKAGKQGIPQAYTLTGMMYLNGRGVAKSKFHAARYFLMAVKGGHIEGGQFLLMCILPVEIK